MEKISVVIPCYNDEAILMKVYKDLSKALKSLPTSYEFIFIDNGSRDHSLTILRRIAEEDYNCNYLSLAKNVSKMEAVFLGAKLSTGEYIGFLDCYHPASLLPSFFEALRQPHCHIVGGEVISNTTKKSGKRQTYFKMVHAELLNDVLSSDNLTAFCDRFYNHTDVQWIQYKELEHVESLWKNRFITIQKQTCNSTFLYPCILAICFVVLPILLIYMYDIDTLFSCVVSYIIGIVILLLMRKHKQKLNLHGKENIKETTFYSK